MRRTGWLYGSLISLLFISAYGFFRVETRPVQLRFRDSVSGIRILPAALLVQRLSDDKSFLIEVADKVDGSGRITLELEPGQYMVSAVEPRFASVNAEVSVAFGEPSQITFMMDPIHLPEPFTSKWIKSQVRKGEHLFNGVVTNDATGLPVSGVLVRSGNVTTQTDQDGYYELYSMAGQLELSREGFVQQAHTGYETYGYGDTQASFTLTPGTGQEKFFEGRQLQTTAQESCKTGCDEKPSPMRPVRPYGATVPALPKNIRVGRNCPSRTTCTSVEVYSVDTYVARVLSSEWYSCWGNVAGGMESLRAGAVAVRSYGVSFVYSPATSTYDICDTTSCQVFGSTTSSNGTVATNDTSRYVVITSAGSIARSEYSAENNNAGCGDGFCGTNTSTAPCISDPVCSGFALFGHGRGLCQWGSARWATGKRLSSSQSCTSAAPNTGLPTKNWIEIIEHYYPLYSLVQGATASITGMSANPNTSPAGTVISLTYNVTATANVTSILGASMAPTGTTTWVSNTANDVELNLISGANSVNRNFAIAAGTPTGTKDFWLSLYYDRNNSNTINSGDFALDDRVFTGPFAVQNGTLLTLNDAQAPSGGTTLLSGTLMLGSSPVVGRSVSFSVSGVGVGSASTNSSGVASLSYSLSLGGPTSFPISGSFSGDTTYGPATDGATLYRTGQTQITTWPVNAVLNQSTTLSAQANFANIQVRFSVDGTTIGTATTNARGLATVNFSSSVIGAHPFTAYVDEQLPHLGSSASSTVTVDRRFP